MAIPTIFRRIFLTNLNVIGAINNDTGTEQILASKIAGLSTSSSATPAYGYTASNVQSGIGFQITFDSPYNTGLLNDGDYMVIAEAYVGTLKVGVTVEKLPGSILVKPDMDGATVRVAIIPLTAG